MKTVVWAVLAAILAGALGFYGGVVYQKSQAQSAVSGRMGGPGGFPGAPGDAGGTGSTSGNRQRAFDRGGVATGTILSQNATSITIKTGDGGSKTIFVTAETRVSKQDQLTVADLKVGDQVAAMGQSANGGIDARSITVVPPGSDFRLGGFGGAPGQGAPPQNGQ
jgi:hypothetical protein